MSFSKYSPVFLDTLGNFNLLYIYAIIEKFTLRGIDKIKKICSLARKEFKQIFRDHWTQYCDLFPDRARKVEKEVVEKMLILSEKNGPDMQSICVKSVFV